MKRIIYLFAALSLAFAGERIRLAPQGDTPGVDVYLSGIEGKLGLTLPELINDPERRIIYTDSNLKMAEWRVSKDGSISSEWERKGLGGYRISATPESDGVRIWWQVQNLSQGKWHDVAGNICMRLSGAPDFFDPTGERIYLRKDGEWVALASVWQRPRGYWFLPPGRKPLPIMKPLIQDGSYIVPAFQPDEAIVAAVSRDGRYVLAHAWKDFQYILTNVRPGYVCLETSPSFGDIGEGGATAVTGKIYFLEGSLERLAAIYKGDVKSGRISRR